MERALHAVLVGYIRNASVEGIPVMPFREDLFDEAVDMARARMLQVEPAQLEHFDVIVERRRQEWVEWQRSSWGGFTQTSENPLLNPAGGYLDSAQKLTTWETMSSMRTVDAECSIQIVRNAIVGSNDE
jgi:hypothetical protein